MAQRKLELVLFARFGNGDEGVYDVKKFKLPPFRNTQDKEADEKFEEFVKDKVKEIQRAIADYEYEQSLPAAGIESGCW